MNADQKTKSFTAKDAEEFMDHGFWKSLLGFSACSAVLTVNS
jgi:hypothetical protein